MISKKGDTIYLKVAGKWLRAGKFLSLNGEKAFSTHVKIPSKHFYRKGLGYPINAELLHSLKLRKCDIILIPEEGKKQNKVYLAKTKDYLNGQYLHDDFDLQSVIPLRNLEEIHGIDFEKLKEYLRCD